MERRVIQANGLRFTTLQAGDGALALCLHGFPDDAGSMVPLLEGLAARGFLAVAPYMRGYRPTELAADGDYSIPTLGADAVALVGALGRRRALVIGHDWGAVAAYAAAAQAPERFRGLVALSVPPLRTFLRNLSGTQARRSWYMGLFQVPLLAERALLRRDLALVDRLWRAWSPGWTPPPGRIAEVKATLRRPGAARAALAYYRGLKRPRAWSLAATPLRVPGRLLVGARDGCVGPEVFSGAEAAFAAPCSVTVVPDAGHFLPLEAPEIVLAQVDDLLAGE